MQDAVCSAGTLVVLVAAVYQHSSAAPFRFADSLVEFKS